MKSDKFRRSENVEDYRDPNKPVKDEPGEGTSINEIIKLTGSDLAHDLGTEDVKKKNGA